MAPRTAAEIRQNIGGRGRGAVRSWDCVCLLRLDDRTLEILARLTAECVSRAMSASDMAPRLPANVSKYQLKLFLLTFYPERWRGLGNGHAGYRQHSGPIDPGPAECHIAYVQRTQNLRRQQAIAFIRDPAAVERQRA